MKVTRAPGSPTSTRTGSPSRARIVAERALRYSAGPDKALDRPAHVRAGSGACVVDTPRGRRLAVIQDDAQFLALVDLDGKAVESVPLPAKRGVRLFDDARGNKNDKLDLEALVQLPVDGGPALVAFGSGSLPARRHLMVMRVDREPEEVRAVDAKRLYEALAAHPLLAGKSLNIEGAALLPNGVLRLVQRGNGADGINAIIDVPWTGLWRALQSEDAPLPTLSARRLNLGTVEGVPLTLTDACWHQGSTWVLAAAEATDNAVDDGEVVGCAIGRLLDDGSVALTPLVGADGKPWIGKPEGLAFDPRDPRRAWVVVDADDAARPATLLAVDVG